MSITCSHDGEPPSTPPAAQTQNANPETSRKRPAVGGTPQLKPRRILHEAKTVAIGGQLFATKAQARERFKQIRDGAPASGVLTPEHEAFVIDCVSAHVKIKKWIEENDGHIERVYVGAGAKAEYGSRSVRVSMRSSRNPNLGETETVGPDPCLDGLFGVKVCANSSAVQERYWKIKREERARDAVKADVTTFRQGRRRISDGLFECAACTRAFPSSGVIVDHVDPLFETILGEFCSEHPTCTLAVDDPLTPRWRHTNVARWVARLLCVGCHYDKTAGETSERARKKQ